MLPSQFKALVETLHRELNAIQKAIREAIEKQNDAASDAKKTAEETRGEPVRAAIVSGALGTVEELNAENSRKDKEHCQQERLIRWTKRAFIAAAIYAGIAAVTLIVFLCQLRTMNDTYGQIKAQTTAVQCAAKAAQQQAELMRRQLVGTQAAIITFWTGGIDDAGKGEVRFMDRGTVNGTVSGTVIVSRVMPNGKKVVLMSKTLDKIVVPSDHLLDQGAQPVSISYSVSGGRYGFDADDLRNLLTHTTVQQLIVNTEWSYDDGFGDIASKSECDSLFSHPATTMATGTQTTAGSSFVPCETWHLTAALYSNKPQH